MNKTFNTHRGGFEAALANLRRHKIRRLRHVHLRLRRATRPSGFSPTVEFASEHLIYIAAFNHLTPFPGTPLYARLQREGRMLYDAWWLDERYSYNQIPFRPIGMDPETLRRGCLESRRKFYSWPGIVRRGFDKVNRSDAFMWRNFYLINAIASR